LEAPTGIGKTKAFLDMISKFQESVQLDRVYYFSPLLALTDDFINNQILEKNIVPEFQRDRVLE
jgi:Lhr-like helicase